MAYKQKNPLLQQISYGPNMGPGGTYSTPKRTEVKPIDAMSGYNKSELNRANPSDIGGVDGVEDEKVETDPVKADEDASATPANKDLENALKENISSGSQTKKIKSLTEKSRDASLSPRKRYKASKKLLNKKSKYEDKQQLMEKKLEKDKIIRAGKDKGKDEKFAEKAEDYKKNNKHIKAAEADQKEQDAIHAYNNQGSMPGDGFGFPLPTPNSRKPFDPENNDADYQMNKYNPQEEDGSGLFTKRGQAPGMNIKNMKQLNRKGHAIPYIEQPMIGAQSNRAGAGVNRNVLTNNPLNVTDPTKPDYKDPEKISANNFDAEQKIADIASSAGELNPDPNAAAIKRGEGGATFTPNTPNAGIDQTFTALNQGVAFNGGKKKEAVHDSEGNPALLKTKENKDGSSTAKIKPISERRFNRLKIKQAEEEGQPGMHTRVTSSNYKSAEKDDAAHASYLKRDVKDIQHSDMSQHKKDEYETADEKHISKLYGDLKYDHGHHGRKYDNV